MTHFDTSDTDRLAALLAKERLQHRTYVGCMKKGPVVNDPNMKWSVQILRYVSSKLIEIISLKMKWSVQIMGHVLLN